jgi:hypothetical protein
MVITQLTPKGGPASAGTHRESGCLWIELGVLGGQARPSNLARRGKCVKSHLLPSDALTRTTAYGSATCGNFWPRLCEKSSIDAEIGE